MERNLRQADKELQKNTLKTVKKPTVKGYHDDSDDVSIFIFIKNPSENIINHLNILSVMKLFSIALICYDNLYRLSNNIFIAHFYPVS